jgi:tRNA (guanine-N7-)-methyltransferase
MIRPSNITDKDAYPDLRSYGRQKARSFSPRQKRLFTELLPQVTASASIDPTTETWLEIGFGGGEHLVWQARANPNVSLIGCEPFEDGVVKVLSAIEDHKLNNIRIHADDARDLIRKMPEKSIARAFVLFPDPWPKKRHVKRRLVAVPLLHELARVMKAGAELRIATDIGDYARTMMIALQATPAFHWTAASPEDWRSRPDDWPGTRYEAKAHREGRKPYFFRLTRM